MRLSKKQRKLVLFIVAIALFFFGYGIAPTPMPDGDYYLHVNYESEDGTELSIRILTNVDSSITQSVLFRQVNESSNGYIMSIGYFSKYSGRIDNEISIFASIYENGQLINNPDIKGFTGIMEGQGQSIDFSASASQGEVIEFNFRILKLSNVALGMLFMISFLWLAEVVPLAATSLLIPIIVVFAGIDTSSGSLSQFSNPTVFLFLAGFIMAIGMSYSKLDEFIALEIISKVPSKPKTLVIAFMALSAGFSMFMSNTAAVTMLIPIALQLLKSVGIVDRKYKKTVILGIAYAATVGGIGTLIGSPPNVIAAGLIENYDPNLSLSFVDWLMFGLPVVVIMLPLVFINLWFRYKPSINEELLVNAKQHCIEELENRGKFTKDQIIVAIIFATVMTLWLTSFIHGISTGIIALVGAVAMYFFGIIHEEDLNKLNWNALITFGGGLTLGTVVIRTGLADWLALRLSNINQLPTFLILLILCLVALLLTAIASNTAAAAIMIPIVMPLAVILGFDPILIAIMIAIVCSVDFAIVIGTPPTLLAYSTGLFTVKEIFHVGILIDLIGLLVTAILSYTLFGFFATLV